EARSAGALTCIASAGNKRWQPLTGACPGDAALKGGDPPAAARRFALDARRPAGFFVGLQSSVIINDREGRINRSSARARRRAFVLRFRTKLPPRLRPR